MHLAPGLAVLQGAAQLHAVCGQRFQVLAHVARLLGSLLHLEVKASKELQYSTAWSSNV